MLSKNPYNLVNKDNYSKKFKSFNTNEYYITYLKLISEFIESAEQNVQISRQFYHKYILEKGIHTIYFVFNLLLLYTKNLDIVIHHCQKSIAYYIEFIGQIGDEHHSFLQLSSTDAALFVYRKSIFDINSDYRKIFELNDNEEDFLKHIDHHLCIINYILEYCFNSNLQKDNWSNIYSDTRITLEHVENLLNCIEKYNITNSILVKKITYLLITLNIDFDQLFDCLILFIKKISKYPNTTFMDIRKKIICLLSDDEPINYAKLPNKLFTH